MFDNLIESTPNCEKRSKSSLLISLMVHGLLLAAIVVIPLIYYDALPQQRFIVFLAAPTPPPPPVPPSQSALVPAPLRTSAPQVVRLDPGVFAEPQQVPNNISPPDDGLPIFSPLAGIPGGEPGGVPGGEVAFVPGGTTGIIPGGRPVAVPPPPPAQKKEPLKVGGGVQAAKLIHRIEPEYPELARRARVYGVVLLKVTVDEVGIVTDVEPVRGHPLLVPAAVDAVRQWRYSPTILNHEPMPVTATVTVNFVLR
jgi:periplasmic protein TonB